MVSNDGGVTFKPIQRDGEPVKPVARWQKREAPKPIIRDVPLANGMIQTMVSNDGGVTFKPIQRDGEPVKPVARWQPKAPTAKEGEITRLMKVKGMTRHMAEGLVDGHITPVSDDFGDYFVDARTNQRVIIPPEAVSAFHNIAKEDTKTEEEAEKDSLDYVINNSDKFETDLKTAEAQVRGGTGPYASIKSFLDGVIGGTLSFTDVPQLFPDTMANRYSLEVIRRLGLALFKLGDKFTVWEQEMVANLWPNPDKFWTNPKTQVDKFQRLRGTLSYLYNDNLKQIGSPHITKAERARRADKNASLKTVLGLMGGVVENQTLPPEKIQEKMKKMVTVVEGSSDALNIYDEIKSGSNYFFQRADGKTVVRTKR